MVSAPSPAPCCSSATDPDGDYNGPGTYAYPTSDNFKPGASDLQLFQVFDSGPDSVTFRVQTRDLTPTLRESTRGAARRRVCPGAWRRDDVYGGVVPAAQLQPSMPASAWNRLIEVQGFGQGSSMAPVPRWAPCRSEPMRLTRFITFTVTKSALGGTPSSGWRFAVVLTGQDGFSPDQARGFTPARAALPVRGLYGGRGGLGQPDLRGRPGHRTQGARRP